MIICVSLQLEISKLKTENHALVQKVSSQTQILEMHIQRDVRHRLAESGTPSPSSMLPTTASNDARSKGNTTSLFGWLGSKSKEETVRDYIN